MAWRAELRRRKWFCILQCDMIHYYSKVLYDEWYASLSEEYKETLKKAQEAKEKRRKEELEASMQRLLFLSQTVCDMANRQKRNMNNHYSLPNIYKN